MKTLLLSLLTFIAVAIPTWANAETISNSVVGVQGYDLVSYHDGKPLPGNGNHVANHNGVNYLFISNKNKKNFQGNPEKYLPAYGGFCAYGVAVGKKFIADPNVWEIVDGQLYLNLDNKIKGIWSKDISGNIKKANANWTEIKGKKPSEL